MFSIKLKLQHETLIALEALDFRRTFGLPDSTTVYATPGPWEFDVPESFARAYFDRDQVTSVAVIPFKFLLPGELMPSPEGPSQSPSAAWVEISPLDNERARELYIAARFAACRAQVGRLTAKVEELEAHLPSEATDDKD